MEDSQIQMFHDAYINADSTELNRLWNEEAPSCFIKFYSARYDGENNNFLDNLRSDKLWLSSPRCFNDPFDSVINFDYEKHMNQLAYALLEFFVGKKDAETIKGWEPANKSITELAAKYHEELTEQNKKFENNIYVTCFSEKENLFSLRMWGHYAANHTGVCAEYDFTTVNNASPFGCIPIKYTDSYEYLPYTNNVHEASSNFLKLFNKASEWKYEKEWRVAQQVDKEKKNGFNISFSKPKSIYMGCKVSDELKNELIHICKEREIELFQMKMKRNSFTLKFEKVV